MPKKWRNRFGAKVSWAVIPIAAFMLSPRTGGPNSQRPFVQTPTDFHGTGGSQQVQAHTESFADLPWWQLFHDPQSQGLIRTALKQNYDPKLSAAR
jgi:multidrug efflux system outer membrane protein